MIKLGKIIKAVSEFLEYLGVYKRCPNCEKTFFKNGKGRLKTKSYILAGEEVDFEELLLCLECLKNYNSLDKERIRKGLKKRCKNEIEIKEAMEAIDKYLMEKNLS